MIKTFRGLLADGGQDRIRLSTKKGKIGYKIVKLEIMPNEPAVDQHESTVKLFKVKQSVVDAKVDFSDGNLLAASLWNSGNAQGGQDAIWVPLSTIFEQEIFNQDVYITHSETDGSNPINYYLELETMVMTDNQAAVSTLRDIRLNPQVGG